MFILEWFAPSWAWSRAEKRLDELFPDVHMRTIVLESLLKLPLRQRLEFFKESAEYTTRLLEILGGLGAVQRDQVGDATVDHSSERARSSAYASELTADELKLLMSTLKCTIIPVEDDKTVFANLQELGQEFAWGRSADQPQVEACIVHMKRHLKLPHGIELVDANNIPFFTGTRGVVYCVHGLDFSVKGRNDVLIVPRSVLNEAEDFVVIGMQIKESLDPESLEHAQAQLIPWGLQSYSAYMQVLSDLRSGGVAWWVDAEEIVPGMQTIRRQFFAGMPAMYSFLNSALAAIPERMSGFDASGHRIEGRETPFSAVLEQPRRRKLEDPSLQEPNALRDIIRNILAARGDDDAAEPDIALADWFPHGGDEPIRFPDEPSSQPCPS